MCFVSFITYQHFLLTQAKPAAFPIASFVWIPTASNTILALTKYNTIETVSVNEAKPISWQPHGALAVVDDQRMINTMSSQHVADNVANEKNAVTNENDTDISEIMRQRTERGYGMLMDKNLVLIADIPGLHAAWQWISRMQDVFTQGKSRIGNHDYTFEGVLSMVSATADARAAIVSGRKASVTALPPRVNGAEGSTAAMAYTAALNNKTTFIPISSSALGLSYAGVTAVTGGSESGKRGHLSPESTNAHGLPFLNMRRKLALQVCGWFYDADDLQASLDGYYFLASGSRRQEL